MDYRSLRRATADSLADASYNPKTLALIHVGVGLVVSLILTVLNYLLDQGLSDAVGIANIDKRAVYNTARTVLLLLSACLMPFWEIGFVSAGLRMSRTRDARPDNLLDGFGRLGLVMRLFLLQILVGVAVVIVCSQVAGVLYSFTPMASEVMPELESYMEKAMESGQTMMSEEELMALMPQLAPMYVFFGVLLVCVGIPVSYLLRLTRFAIMDDATGAWNALRVSLRLMVKNLFKMILLDLRFWWYYALRLLVIAVAYADLLLVALGVELPVSADVLLFASFGVHMVLQLVVAWLFDSSVQTTYSHFYNRAKERCAK